MHERIALVLLLLISSQCFAAYVDFMPLVPLTAFIVVIFLAGAYMLSSSLSLPPFHAWVKTEMRELIAGAILISIIFSGFVLSNSITVALTGHSDYMQVSINTLDNMISGDRGFDRAYHDVIVASAKVKAGATYSPVMSLPLWVVYLTYRSAPYAGIMPILTSLGMASQALASTIYLYEGLLLLLKFSAVVVPSMVLPLSFCLRLVPFTRRIGNTLIAISLALLVIFPFSVVLVDYINQNVIEYPDAHISGRDMDKLDADPWAMVMAEPFCASNTMRTIFGLGDTGFSLLVCFILLLTPFTAAMFTPCYNLIKEVVYPLMNTVFSLLHTIVLLIWTLATETRLDADSGWASDVFDVTYAFLVQVDHLILLSYINFIIIITLVIVGARSISVALGGEWYLAGIQRLV